MLTSQPLGQNPFPEVGAATAFAGRDEQEDEMQLALCTECTKNYEREATLVKAEADAEGPRASLPGWLVLDRPPADQTPHEVRKQWQWISWHAKELLTLTGCGLTEIVLIV